MLLVELPCKRLVMQYLVNKYESEARPLPHERQIILPNGDPHLTLLYNLLTRSTAEFDKKYTLQFYTCKAFIPVEFMIYERKGLVLSKTAIVAINNTIEDLIHDRLSMILDFYTSQGFQLKAAIDIFRQTYNFTEEAYSSDAIIKYWQRHAKNRITTHKIIAETVLFAKTA